MSDIDRVFDEMMRPRVIFGVASEELELLQQCATERGVSVEQYVYEIVMNAVNKNKPE